VHTDNEQRAANLQAKLAVRCLARLGGYLDAELASPPNSTVRRVLTSLLTPPLAKRLMRPSSDPLLRVLNGSEESALVVWTPPMRKELLGFLGAAIEHLARSGGVADNGPALALRYSALREELRVSGIYVRFYVSDPAAAPEDPYSLVLGLLQHIAFSRVGGSQEVPAEIAAAAVAAQDEEGPAYPYSEVPSDVATRHLRLSLRALHLVLVNCVGVEAAVSREGSSFLRPLFTLFEKEDSGAAASSEDAYAVAHAAALQTNKGAAGSGASAGAGGARSTPAPPTASLRELVLTAIAAFAPNEACSALVASLHLIPVLIRQLPRDSGSFGPILRTLFSHAVVISEAARIGSLLDLALIFVGGPASGAAPKPGSRGQGLAPAAMGPGFWSALWPSWSAGQWGLMAYASVLGSALAYGLFFWFASSGDLTGFTALTFLTPVFALLCGVLFLEESLEPLQWVGALLALVSVLLINRRQQIWRGTL
jgi:hypothetical protein